MSDGGGRVWLALVLAGGAGSVDAIVFLTLLPVFVSFMSGNSVQTGLALAQVDWPQVWSHLMPVPLFVLGVATGTAVVEVAHRRTPRRSLSWVLGLELLLLAGVLVGSLLVPARAATVSAGWVAWPLTASAVVAMGLQNAAFRRLGGLTVRTTFVTGLLTTLAEETAKYLLWRFGAARSTSAPSTGPAELLALAGVWCGYLAGAVVGGVAAGLGGVSALAIPVGLVATALLIDLARSDAALSAHRDAP